MARIVSIFQFTGRGGSAVGSKGKGGNQTGYVIDLNKVSATNYDFSPCVSAALNVEGNGNEGPEGE